MSDPDHSRILCALEQRAVRHYYATGYPFVTLSYAQSLNGAIAAASGQPITISCPQSLVYTHALRAMHDAILVGIETILADDPALTTRLVEGENPQRLILDSRLRIPLSARVLSANERPTLVITTKMYDAAKASKLEEMGVEVVCLESNSNGQVDLRALMLHLGKLGIQKLMVEGGGKVIANFLKERCVDHMIVTLSMIMLGGRPVLDSLPQMPMNGHGLVRLNPQHPIWVGSDLILHGDPVWEGW